MEMSLPGYASCRMARICIGCGVGVVVGVSVEVGSGVSEGEGVGVVDGTSGEVMGTVTCKGNAVVAAGAEKAGESPDPHPLVRVSRARNRIKLNHLNRIAIVYLSFLWMAIPLCLPFVNQ